MRFKKQKGFALLTIIIAIVMMTALGAGIYTLTTSSTFSELLATRDYNAYQLAKSGLRYAAFNSALSPEGTYNMSDGQSFTITSTTVGGLKQYQSVGNVNQGSFLAANRKLAYNTNVAAALTPPIIDLGRKDNYTINPIPGTFPTSPIVFNEISPGSAQNTVTLGNNTNDAYGNIVYQGGNAVGSCVAGKCSFGLGLRVYFDFTFKQEDHSASSTTYGDGFTFAVWSAINNTIDRTAGAPSTYSEGELMGYAGPGNTSDKLGLNPPKMALEFDVYPNSTNDVCQAGSRDDPTGNNYNSNHTAIMFWGSRTLSGNCSNSNNSPKGSFDDNRHNAGGSGTDPQNADHVSGTNHGFYAGAATTCLSSANTCNWMEDGYPYSVRIEIVRPTSSSGTYEIRSWIVRKDTLSGLTQSKFQDVTVQYTDTAANIVKTGVSLSAQDHSDFDKIYLGFTEATGGAYDLVTIANLSVFFPQDTACTYSISPTDATYTWAAGTGSVMVTTTSNCYWMASSVGGSDWITITSGTYGKGNGTVNYALATNSTGSSRTGYINIAGQTFTVYQAASNCTYALSADSNVGSPLAKTAGSNGTVTVTAGTGCPWTTSNNGNTWITVTPARGTGTGGAQSVAYAATANTGAARHNAITIGWKPFEVYQASGCTYTLNPASAAPPTSGGNYSFTITAGAGCPWTASVTSGATWITALAPVSGTGTGGPQTITYNVAANPGPGRNGSITVAGQIFLVSQKGDQTIGSITFTPSTLAVGGTTTVSATATSGLAVTFSSLTTSVCTISGSTVTGVAAGACTIAANQAGDANYNAAPQVTGGISVGKGNQATLTVNATTPLAYLASQTLSTSGGSGTGAVTYAATGGGGGSCTVSGSTLTAQSGTGYCDVTATKDADTNYNAATSGAVRVTLSKANQATLTVNATTPLAYLASETLSTLGGSGTGAVTYAASGSCTVAGSTLTANSGTGTCSVTATKATDTNYNATTSGAVIVTLIKISQAITVTTHAPVNAPRNSTFTVAATASSGLSVAYSSSGRCTNSGAVFTMTNRAGTCSVYYNQVGDNNYNAASQAIDNTTVN